MCIEKICEWHKNPVNAFFHLIAFIVLVYGLWVHSFREIIIAIAIAILGHLIQLLAKPKKLKQGKKTRR